MQLGEWLVGGASVPDVYVYVGKGCASVMCHVLYCAIWFYSVGYYTVLECNVCVYVDFSVG